MNEYFKYQPKVINGVPQRLYYLLERGPDDLSVMSLFEYELYDFSKNYEFVRQATQAMAVFKLKENI